MKYQRKRTNPKDIAYSLYLYFLGLSYRNTAKALQGFVRRSHISIWKWIQKYRPKKLLTKRKKIDEFIIDKTLIRIGSQYVWLWVAIEPKNKQILHIDISFDKTMLIVAERFIASLINIHGKHPVSTDGGTWHPLQACTFLKQRHHLHSTYEKSIIERARARASNPIHQGKN